MKDIRIYLALLGCLISLQNQWVFGQVGSPPAALHGFWSGMKKNWLPENENAFWTDQQRKDVRKYCKTFAENNGPKDILPGMMEDLKLRTSEVNSFIYIWVALNWNAKEVMAILEPYYNGKDPLEKQIASDFIAEIEEGKK